MSYPDPKQNPKNATNLLADVNIGRDANVARDVTVQNNVNLGEKVQPIDLAKDTLFVDGSLNVNGLMTVDYTSGLVQIANDLIVYGRLVVPEIDYTGIVTVGDNITFNGHDGSISSLTVTAATGTFNRLLVTDQSYFQNTMNVQHQTGVFGTVIADRFIGPFDAPTGYIHDFTVDNLYVNSSATFTGPATFNGTLIAQSGTFASLSATSLSAQSGSFATLSATGINAQTIVSQYLTVQSGTFVSLSAQSGSFSSLTATGIVAQTLAAQTGTFVSLFAQSGTFSSLTATGINAQIISAQTGTFVTVSAQSGTFSSLSATGIFAQSGTFSTVVATGVYASTVVATTGIFQNLVTPSLDVQNLIVRQDLYLGNEIKPLDPTIDDTLFVDATLNVANILVADKETGLITVPNNLTVMGRLEVAEIGYTNLIQIGSQIKLDGVANTITAYNSDGALTYTLDAQTGNTIAPTTTGWFGTIIADKFVGPISLNTGTLTALTGVFDNLSVKNLYVSDSATFTGPLVAQTINVQSVSAQSVSSQTISAQLMSASTGLFASLNATGATISSLIASSGTITNLSSTTLTASTGVIASLFVQTGTFATLSAQQLIVSSGIFNSLSATSGTIANFSATTLTAASGTITNLSSSYFTATSGSIGSLTIQTGAVATLNVQQLNVSSGAAFSGSLNVYTTLNAAGQTGVFGTVVTDNIQLRNDLSVHSLTVQQDIYLGNEIKPLDPTIDDTLFVDATLNVANIFIADKETGLITVPNNMTILGRLEVAEIGYTNVVEVGTQIIIDGVNNKIVLTNADGTITSIQDAQTGNLIAPTATGWFGTVIADKFIGPIDLNTGTLTALTGVFDNLSVKRLYVSESATFTGPLVAQTINTQSVNASSGYFVGLSATGATIASLVAQSIVAASGSFAGLNATGANIASLFATSGSFVGLNATGASISLLTAQTIISSSGSFDSLKATGAYITTLAAQSLFATSGSFSGLTATGANITTLVAQSIVASSGSFATLNAQSGTFGGISVTSGAAFSGAFNMYTTLNAAGQTGVFGTIVTDNIELRNDLTVHNLTVTQDITLGNELKPIDPTVSDTLFVEGSLNVSNIFLADTVTGLITIPNDLLVYGRLEVNEIGYTNVVQVGTQIVLDGAAAQIILTSADGTITSVQDAQTGNLIAKSATGWFGTIIADNFAGTGSFVQANINNLEVFQSATFTGPVVINNSLFANSGTINTLYSGTGFFDTVVANHYIGPISTQTGSFTSLTTSDLYVTHSATFTGPVTAQGPVTVGLLTATTGSISSLTTTTLYVNNSATFTGPVTMGLMAATTGSVASLSSSDLYVSHSATFTGPVTMGQITATTGSITSLNATQISSQSITSLTGIFAGISVGSITGSSATFDTIHLNNETIQNLTVYNDIALGNQIVPVDPLTNDTMFINSNLNVANVFTIDQLTGEIVIPNNLTVMGRLDIKEIGYIGTLSVGTDIILDGINNQIVTLNDAGTITSTLNAQNGNFIAPTATGQFGTIIADKFVGVFSTTGAIDELTVVDLFVTRSATFTGPVIFNNLVTAQAISTQSITSTSGSFAQLYAANINISTGSAQVLNVASLQAQTGTINSLTSLSISSASMSISTGSVGLLSVSSLQAQTGTINTLTTSSLIVSTGSVNTLFINSLQAQTGTITTFTTSSLSAASGSVQLLNVSSLQAQTGIINSLTSAYASISSLNVATGSAQLLNVASLQAQTGTVSVLTAPVLFSTTGTITNLSSASGTFVNLSASTITASTGIFTTFETTELIIDDNLIVVNNLILGNSIVPLQPTIQDTMYVDAGFNVANVFTIDNVSGETICANDLTVAGTLHVVNIDYAGAALFGSTIAINGANGVQTFVDGDGNQTISLDANSGTIKCNNISVPAYFSALSTGPTTIYQAGDALRGQVVVPDGQSTIRIYTTKVFTTSYANAVIMTPTSIEMVQCVTPYNGYLDIVLTGTSGDRALNWIVIN